jgi:Trk K+ transport system NAD-binding subunit
LPVPTTKDGVTVYGADITLDAVTESAEGTDVIVGYGLPSETVAKLEAKKCRVIDALYDEEFLCANAELTAIGTLGHILSTERTSPGELSFGIIGYGRIGRRLVRHLLFLGADVKVFTSKTVYYHQQWVHQSK